MSLGKTFQHHARVLAAKSAALEAIHHAGDRGAEREGVLEDFLLPLLPERINIGRGEIRATNGKWSKQEDLILYDRLNCPRLFVGDRSQVFPVESVGAVIEVKTRLGTKEIREASENIAALKKLEKTGNAIHIHAGALSLGLPTPTLGCLFAYDLSLAPETFMQRWAAIQLGLPPTERINLVCVLNKFTLIYVDRVFHLWDSLDEELLDSIMFIESNEDTLMTFTLLFLRALTEIHFGTPDLFKYYLGQEDQVSLPYKYLKIR